MAIKTMRHNVGNPRCDACWPGSGLARGQVVRCRKKAVRQVMAPQKPEDSNSGVRMCRECERLTREAIQKAVAI